MDKEHPEVKFGKTGVLLINLGTPDSTGYGILEIFKRIFRQKSNRSKSFIWQIILNLFILTFRPSKTAHAYKQPGEKKATNLLIVLYKKSGKQT